MSVMNVGEMSDIRATGGTGVTSVLGSVFKNAVKSGLFQRDEVWDAKGDHTAG